MRGDEKYKYNWSTNESVLKDLLVFRNTAKSLLIFGYMKTMKRLRESELVGRTRKYFGHGKQGAYSTEDKEAETGED
jgi:CelD/BcsL family acetyltransferase involved in cellulose biosynthesis